MKAITGQVVEQSGALTARESQQLKAAETDIEKGGTLIVSAMQLIRDKRLYRAEFSTFEDYCRERWNRTHRSVNNAIQMEAVVQRIAEVLPDQNGKHVSQTQPILTHRAAAEVADLPPEQAAGIVQKSSENGKKPTAKAVKQAREESGAPPKGAGGGKSTAVSDYFGDRGGTDKPDDPAEPLKTQRSKTVKTVQALMRAFDDLNEMAPKVVHATAMGLCKDLLKLAEDWK